MKNFLKFSDLKISDFKCLNRFKTIHSDFSYYRIKVGPKNGSYYKDLLYHLEDNNCIFRFFYKDYVININDYTNPVKPILKSFYLPLNSGFNIKKNVYFMNYIFKDNKNYLTNLFDFDDNTGDNYTFYSIIEDNLIYEDNNVNNPYEEKKYATLYLRASNRITEINREYQNFLDFYAENTSFWFGIFEFLNIFFTIYNGFHANLSMSKKLFFFDEKNEDIKRINPINSNKSLINKKSRNSINTINIINLNEMTNIKNDNNDNNIDINNNKDDNNKKNENENIVGTNFLNDNNVEKNEEVKI